MKARFEPITGRYMHLDLVGRPHRVYVEEAGEGTPLLCLHTAGSDGRQYRGLMNDTRVTAKHRVIAFDMPWHGKSSPPSGWHEEEYQLTSAQYTTMILEISAALELDRPILIGCSIGGRIALHMALEHPESFRAIIGLQAGAHVDPYYDLNFLHRADVHGGEVCGAIVSGLVGPDAPDSERSMLSPNEQPWSEVTSPRITTRSIRLIAPRFALVECTNTQYGSVLVVQTTSMLLVMKKDGEQWRIASVGALQDPAIAAKP
jgi:pimeloyl-ACP methyl ester carboxylesterase